MKFVINLQDWAKFLQTFYENYEKIKKRDFQLDFEKIFTNYWESLKKTFHKRWRKFGAISENLFKKFLIIDKFWRNRKILRRNYRLFAYIC